MIFSSAAKELEESTPTLVNPLKPKEVTEGSDVALECKVGGKKLDVEWQKDNKPIPESPRIERGFDGQNAILVIHNATLDDEGDYMCVVGNALGEVSTAADLIVEEAQVTPIVSEKKEQVVEVSEGSEARFDVRITGAV